MVSIAARTQSARTAVPSAPYSTITARHAIHICASQPVAQPRPGPTRAPKNSSRGAAKEEDFFDGECPAEAWEDLADAAARPVTRRVFHGRRVPSAVAFKKAASGTPDARRWAAPQPEKPCRTAEKNIKHLISQTCLGLALIL
jgi:hypothetical protein